MCRSCAEYPPRGRRCPALTDPARRLRAQIRQRIGRNDRAARAASETGDWARLEKHVALLDRDIALLDATTPVPDTPVSGRVASPPAGDPAADSAAGGLVAPDTIAEAFTAAATLDWSDDDLLILWGELHDDPAAQDQILATLDWREHVRAERDAEIAEHEQHQQQQRAERAERERAWQAAQDQADASPLTNPARRASRRLTPEQVCREEYDAHLHHSYLSAEQDCRGVLLNRTGQAAGLDPASLFTGPASRVRKYASEELRTWFTRQGRITYSEWKYQWLGRDSDRDAARTAHYQYLGEATA